jgi:hypothetical protein
MARFCNVYFLSHKNFPPLCVYDDKIRNVPILYGMFNCYC